MLIDINNFKGTVPCASIRRLPVNVAQTAQNCDFRRGTLAALYAQSGSVQAVTQSTPKTIYKLGSTWLAFTNIVEVVKAPVADSDDRILFTGDAVTDGDLYPKCTDTNWLAAGLDPTTVRRLGVVAPIEALTISVQGSGDGTVVASVAYVYTLVTAWGEESAISPVSAVEDVQGGQYVRLSNFTFDSLGNTGNDYEYIRVYRVNVTASGQKVYRLTKIRPLLTSNTEVYDIPTSDPGSGEFIDADSDYAYDCNATPDGLTMNQDETLKVMDWTAPPDDLEGLVLWQDVMLAGFVDQTVYVSVPGYYYAFPADYALELDFDAVALGTYKEFLIVATTAKPYVIIGSSLEALNQKMLGDIQPCVSKRGLVSTDSGVVWPSKAGLVLCDGYNARLITESLYTPEQFEDLGPQNLIAAFWQGNYVGFFNGTATGIIVTLSGDTPYVVNITTTHAVYGLFVSADDNALYLLTKSGSDYMVEKWEGAASLGTYVWKSGQIMTRLKNFAVAKVIGDFTASKTTTFKWYADEVLKHTKTVSSDDWFYLPSGFLAETHEFYLSGTAPVDRLLIADSPEEFANV